MERTLKETYDALYSAELKDLEKNLDRLIELKHNELRHKVENETEK